jgi:hypothetical protein
MNKILFDATFSAINGELLKGPVTVNENGEYLFRNQHTADDIYFYLKKTNDEWHFAGGPSTYNVPREFIKSVGEQIDEFNNSK